MFKSTRCKVGYKGFGLEVSHSKPSVEAILATALAAGIVALGTAAADSLSTYVKSRLEHHGEDRDESIIPLHKKKKAV